MEGPGLSPAAQALYNNRREAMERNVRIQMANLTPDMYTNFNNITSKYSGISNDLVMAMVKEGLTADTPGIKKIVSLDGISQLKKDMFNVDKIKSTVDKDKGFLGAIKGAYQSLIYDPLKGVTRIGFAALRYPYDLITTLTRDVYALDETVQSRAQNFTKNLATLGGKNTLLGSLIADTVGGKKGVQTGSGFFINPNSRVGKAQAKAMSSYGTIEGESFTIGRNLFRVMADNPDKTAYKVSSGIVDAVLNVALDPSTWFFGAGAASKIISGGKKVSELKEIAKITTPESIKDVAKGKVKRTSNNLARNRRKLLELESTKITLADKEIKKILQTEKDIYKSFADDPVAQETFSSENLTKWLLTNPKVQTGEMLKGLDKLAADHKALSGISDGYLLLDEVPEANKVSVGVLSNLSSDVISTPDEYFVTLASKAKLNLVDLADNAPKTGKQVQAETNRRNLLIEQINDYARDPNLAPEVRGAFAGIADEIKVDVLELKGFGWMKSQVPGEAGSNKTLAYVLGQIAKTNNKEALTMAFEAVEKIWQADGFLNVRNILGETGGVLITNSNKVAANYAEIGNALSEIAAPTNLGPNLAKLMGTLDKTDAKIKKTSDRVKKLNEERDLLQRQIKDIDLFTEYAAKDPELLTKMINDDSYYSGLDNILKLKPDLDQKDLLAEGIREKLGSINFPGGSIAENPDFGKVLKYMLGRQFQEVAEVVAKETSLDRIRTLFGKKLPADMIAPLAAADNANDVLRVFLQHMGAESTDPQIFRSMALRGEAARLSTNPLARLVQPVNLVPIRTLEAMDRSLNRFFVRQTVLNLNDLTGLTNGVEDWVSSAQFKTMLGKEGQEKLISSINEKLLRSTNEQQRAAIITDSLADAMRQAGAKYDLKPDDIEELVKKVKASGRVTAAETRYTVGKVIDGGAAEIIVAGGETISLGKAISYFQAIKGTIHLPDTKDILGSFNKYKMNKARYNIRRSRVFAEETGDIWRTAQLAFRYSYILRNIGEMQMRQLLSGHTNIISNPLQFISMVMANSGKTNALTTRIAKGQYDLAGNRFNNLDAEGEYLEAIRGYQKEAFRRESVSDYRDNRSSEIFKFYKVLEANPQMSKETKKQFYQGLAYTLNRFASDPINSKVARLMAVGDEDAKRTFVQNIIDDFDNPNGLVQQYISGVFKENDGIRRIFFKDIDLPEEKLMTKENLSFEKLFIFLFDESQTNTIAGQIRAIAGQGPKSKEIFDILADAGPIRAPWNVKTSTVREFDALEKSFATQLEKRFSLEDISGTRVLSEKTSAAGVQTRAEINALVDKFFAYATKLESKYNFGPEYQMAYWDFVGRYFKMLDDKELKKVYISAQRSLAPFRVGGKRTIDEISGKEVLAGGRTLGRGHPVLRSMKTEIKQRAKGKRVVTKGADWVTIHQMAAKESSKYVKDLFYDASRQKQWAQAYRLLVPFAQAHTNTIYKWGQLASRNPVPGYRFFKTFDALTKEGSNVIYDVTGMTYDDQQGFLYNQEGREGKMFKMPLVGNFIGAAAGKNINMRDALQLSAPVESLNLAWGQVNPLVPGFGPMAQAAFIGSGKVEAFGSGYQVLRDIVTPFGKADNVEDILFPAWIRKTALFWLGNDAEVQRKVKDWASYLASSGEYGDNPLANDETRTRLFSDAEKLSRNLGIWTGIFQAISPATPSTEILASIKNPDNKMSFMTMTILYEHFQRITEANPGNYQAAIKQFADTYGKNNLLIALGAGTSAVRGTDDAWRFLNNNPDAAAKYARSPGDIVPYFFPGGEYSQRYKNWQRSTGARRQLSTNELANEAESMVYAMLKSQIVEEQIANGYPQFWYTKEIDKLDKAFGGRPTDMVVTGTAQERIARVGEALEDKAFQDSPVYNETVEFYSKYSEFQKMLNELKVSNYAEISAKGGYPTLLRNDLISTAERLMLQNPSFSRMYYGVFYGQLEG